MISALLHFYRPHCRIDQIEILNWSVLTLNNNECRQKLGQRKPWSQVWRDCGATGACKTSHFYWVAVLSTELHILTPKVWLAYFDSKVWFDLAKKMLGKVLYRKATLEDWGDIERVSQVVAGRASIDVHWLDSSGRVWGARLPAKFLQCVDYWRRDREDSQVVHTRPAWSKTCQSFKQVQLCGRVGWKCRWILLSTLHEVNMVAMEAWKGFNRFWSSGWLIHRWV